MERLLKPASSGQLGTRSAAQRKVGRKVIEDLAKGRAIPGEKKSH